jgi:hypothetical protein
VAAVEGKKLAGSYGAQRVQYWETFLARFPRLDAWSRSEDFLRPPAAWSAETLAAFHAADVAPPTPAQFAADYLPTQRKHRRDALAYRVSAGASSLLAAYAHGFPLTRGEIEAMPAAATELAGHTWFYIWACRPQLDYVPLGRGASFQARLAARTILEENPLAISKPNYARALSPAWDLNRLKHLPFLPWIPRSSRRSLVRSAKTG